MELKKNSIAQVNDSFLKPVLLSDKTLAIII